MKLIYNFLIISLILLYCSSCKTLFKSKNKTSVETHVALTNYNVSFISIGGGIDQNANDKFLKFVDDFQKENKDAIKILSSNWGREGELDYCVQFLKENRKIQFIKDVKELLKDCSLVRYKVDCIHN